VEKKKERPSLVKRPPSDITKAFPTGRPMVDTPKMLKCNHCKRTVTEHAMPKHIERCLNKKQEKQRKKKEAKDARDAAARKEKGQDSDEEEDGERSAVKGGAASKKRKAADEAEEGVPTKKKKKKDEAKAKASKPKAPVDVERQCGVELPLGGQCARSLTCKSHSMGAKRAVAGRSAPYDKLLMEYQRKNAARQQKAAFDANAPDPEDDAVPSGPIDEQAETDQFMAAIAQNWGGAPLVQPKPYPLAKKYDRVRIEDMIKSAGPNLFAPVGRVNGGGGVAFGQTRDANDDDVVPTHARKTSVIPGARSMVPPASRKASVVSTGA
jgi:SAGA-associated factor 73